MQTTRRKLFTHATGVTLLSLIGPSFLTKVRAESDGMVEIVVEISRNHRHALELTNTQLVEALKLAQNEGSVSFDIQGQSSHPHDIELNEEQLMAILAGEQVEAQSTVVANHSHKVSIFIG